MFDCRSNANILLHAFEVTLANVLDLQPMATVASSPQGLYLVGLDKVFEHFSLFGEDTARITDAGRQLFDPANPGGRYAAWGERPLREPMLQYCAVAVQHFFLATRMMKEYIPFGYFMSDHRLRHIHSFVRQACNKRRDFSYTNPSTFMFKTPDDSF